MPRLGRGLLLVLTLLLAACGTQTQLPENLTDTETNIETASGGKLHVYFKKVVEGKEYGPKYAKYKVQLICHKYGHHQRKGALSTDKLVLRRNMVVSQGQNVYSGDHYGVKGYKCFLREIAKDYYSVGDHVRFYVEQDHNTLHDETKYDTGRKTVDSGYFYPKDGKLIIIVTNTYKPPAQPPTPKKVTVKVDKSFKSHHHYSYYPDAHKYNLKVVLVCGHEKYELLNNTLSYHSELDIYGKHCYLAEWFYSKHYQLRKVEFDFKDYYDKYDSYTHPHGKYHYYAKSKHFKVDDYTLAVHIYDTLKKRHRYHY